MLRRGNMPGTTTPPNSRFGRIAIVGVLIAVGIALSVGVWLSRPPQIGRAVPSRIAPTPALTAPAGFPEFTSPPRSQVSEEEAATAIAINAATPSVPDQVIRARPFTFAPDTAPEDRLRARDCLAAAVYYEAGVESPQGQRAVAQVVLNRVRNPVFPQTVCDVVFQGAARATGCQFTFTCDGALARRPDPVAWRRAVSVAADALAGVVEPSVGTATHYHANWVVPYWRSTLVKLSTIGTHIFYRWQGALGGKAAFARGYHGGETVYPQLALAIGTDPAAGNVPMMTMPALAAKTVEPDTLPPRQILKVDSGSGPLMADERGGALIDSGSALDPPLPK